MWERSRFGSQRQESRWEWLLKLTSWVGIGGGGVVGGGGTVVIGENELELGLLNEMRIGLNWQKEYCVDLL
jgi:hypothetical protein